MDAPVRSSSAGGVGAASGASGDPAAASHPAGDPRGYWDRIGARYGHGPPSPWRMQSDLVNSSLIERWLPPDPHGEVLKTDLFDEVAGRGIYPLLAQRYGRAVAIDVSPSIVRSARERIPALEAEPADVRALPFAAASFDAVVSNSTLDHFSGRTEVTTALRELARVLRVGGRLLVTLDNPLNPLIALRDKLPRGLARRARGVSYDSGWTCGPRALGRMLAETGFEVHDSTAVLHLPRVLMAPLERALPAPASPRLARLVNAAEQLERLPTSLVTGHFVAVLAVRAEDGLLPAGAGAVHRMRR